jgi:hypothetical protein
VAPLKGTPSEITPEEDAATTREARLARASCSMRLIITAHT